jgi:hypothetical protein
MARKKYHNTLSNQESEPEKAQDAAETLTFKPVIFPVVYVKRECLWS